MASEQPTPSYADHRAAAEPAYASDISEIQPPPKTIGGILRRLGPGLIIAGSIVGSGELIATTKTGAEAGFTLLWLIIIGCVIKVFAQVELGRFTIIHGLTTMEGMNTVPGPRLNFGQVRGNWFLWYWVVVFLVSIGQLGGIVGGVGQAMAISVPLTEQGRLYNKISEERTQATVKAAQLGMAEDSGEDGAERATRLRGEIDRHNSAIGELTEQYASRFPPKSPEEVVEPQSQDDVYWAAIIAVITSVVLYLGRYGFIQSFATVLVASFTVITVVNLIALQNHPDWAVGAQDLLDGISFQLAAPGSDGELAALAVALATFGIIGVGGNELISYPYWCLEKGYARFTGPRDDSAAWGERARGWMRVMQWDAWCSMVVYTFATIAFYLLGAAILGRSGLDPEGAAMIRTLGVMYEPVFGTLAQLLFLFGAFAVLYSTFFVANASQARVAADAFRVYGVFTPGETNRRRWVRRLSALLPLLCLAVYVLVRRPVLLVLLSGTMQAVMLPMIAAGTLYFRYRRCDERVKPGMLWDAMLWLSALGLLLAGGWAAVSKALSLFQG